MEQLGYHPNLTARSLRSARTTTIGFLLLDEGARYLADPMTDQVIAGVGDIARDRGYSVLIHAGRPGPPDSGLLKPVLESRVDGVLLFLSGPARPAGLVPGARGRAERADGGLGGGARRRRAADVGHRRQPQRRPLAGGSPNPRRAQADRVHRGAPAVADGRAAPPRLLRGARGRRPRARPLIRALRGHLGCGRRRGDGRPPARAAGSADGDHGRQRPARDRRDAPGPRPRPARPRRSRRDRLQRLRVRRVRRAAADHGARPRLRDGMLVGAASARPPRRPGDPEPHITLPVELRLRGSA